MVEVPWIVISIHARERLDEREILSPIGLELHNLSKKDRRKIAKNNGHRSFKVNPDFIYLKSNQPAGKVVYIFRQLKRGDYLLITAYPIE